MWAASRELKIGQRITWVDDTRSSLSGAFSATGGSLAGDCVKYLQENKLIPSRIGLAGVREFLSYREFQRLVEGAGGSEFVDAAPLMSDMRMTKSCESPIRYAVHPGLSKHASGS